MSRAAQDAAKAQLQIDVPADASWYMWFHIRSTGQITYTSRWSGTTFTVNLNVGGQRAAFAYSPGGTLYRVRAVGTERPPDPAWSQGPGSPARTH